MKDLINRNFNKICLFLFSSVLVFITVAPFIVLCFYNQPSDNDNWAIFYGYRFIKSFPLLHKLFSFRPRGFFHFTEFFDIVLYNHPNGFDYSTWMTFIRNYHIKAFVWLFSFFVSCTVLFKTLNSLFLKYKGVVAFFLYSLFLYLCFNGIHWAEMVFYEHVSCTSYTSAACYFLLFISAILKFYSCKSKTKTKIIFGLFSFLSLYACINCLEIYSFICGFIIFTFILYDYIKNKKINAYFCFLLIVCLVIFFRDFYFVRNYVLPDSNGSVGKYKEYTAQYSMFQLILRNVIYLCNCSQRYFDELLFEKKYFPFFIVLSGGAVLALKKNNIIISVRFVLPFFIPIICITIAFGFAVPNIFYMNRYTWTIYLLLTFYFLIFFISVLMWFSDCVIRIIKNNSDLPLNNLICSKKIIQIILNRFLSKKKNVAIFFSICGICMLSFSLRFSNSTIAWAWKDVLKGHAKVYNSEINERYKKIFDAHGGPVGLKSLTYKPHSLFYNDSVENSAIIWVQKVFENPNIYLEKDIGQENE